MTPAAEGGSLGFMADNLPDAGALAPLVGGWTVEAEFADLEPSVVRGRSTFDWELGRLRRPDLDPDAPDPGLLPSDFAQRFTGEISDEAP
jgi:hypothetical protein